MIATTLTDVPSVKREGRIMVAAKQQKTLKYSNVELCLVCSELFLLKEPSVDEYSI